MTRGESGGASAQQAGMVGWARTLLRSTKAAAVVNGHMSGQRTWGAGVRQGCPLAPAMYLFVAWTLTTWIHASPSAGVLIAGARLVSAQFADDCTALLKVCNEGKVLALLAAMEIFAKATGQRLNLKKCRILPLGVQPAPSPSAPTTLGSIPVCTTATTLGITFSNDPGEEQQHPLLNPHQLGQQHQLQPQQQRQQQQKMQQERLRQLNAQQQEHLRASQQTQRKRLQRQQQRD